MPLVSWQSSEPSSVVDNGSMLLDCASNKHMALASSQIPRSTLRARSSSPTRAREHPRALVNDQKQKLIDSWNDDIFKDFDIIYESMKNLKISGTNSAHKFPYGSQTTPRNMTMLRDTLELETDSLNRSLGEVEESYKRAVLTQSPSDLPESMLSARTSPIASIGAYSELTRADSQNTNQSFQVGGPALIEEMTLSDLEDEISSAIMSGPSKSSSDAFGINVEQNALLFAEGEQMLRSMRNRAPIPASISRLYLSKTFQQPQQQSIVANGRLESTAYYRRA